MRGVVNHADTYDNLTSELTIVEEAAIVFNMIDNLVSVSFVGQKRFLLSYKKPAMTYLPAKSRYTLVQPRVVITVTMSIIGK